MKKLLIIAGILVVTVSMLSCGGAEGNDPGEAYMPDMWYSRAYEAYDGQTGELKKRGINYNATPVPGTIARGDYASYSLPNTDSGYAMSKALKNPFDTVTFSKANLAEAERLYLINCGICHGSKLDGNGPLWKDGNGPYPAAPRNLLDDYSKNLSDGQYYHVITYGKGQMGSYASQLHPEQRWWVTKYIRSKQGGGKDTAAASATTGVAPADTTKQAR